MKNTTSPIVQKLRASAFLLALVVATAFAGSAHAADRIKQNNTTALNLAGSWDTLPGSGDVGVWNSTVVGANASALGAGVVGGVSWQGIRIANPGGLATIGNTTTAAGGDLFSTTTDVLTLGTSGIDLSAATQNLLINGNMTIGGNQTWTVANGRTLQIQTINTPARMTGSGNISLVNASGTGTATFDFRPGNSGSTAFTDQNGFFGYSGSWTVGANCLVKTLRNGGNCWGSGTLILAGGTVAQQQNFSGTWNNPITLQTSTTSTIDDANSSGTRTLKLLSVISGSGNLNISETGAASHSLDGGVIIAAANPSMSGTITINSPAVLRIGAVGTAADVSTTVGPDGTIGTANVVNNSVLTLSRNNTWTFANVVSGTGSLRIGLAAGSATHIATVSGNNSHSGGTVLGSAVTLNIGHANALGTGAFTINGNGIFDNGTGGPLTVANAFTLSGGSPTFTGTSDMTINGAVTLAGANRTITANGGTLTLGGAISGAFNLTKQGVGTLVLNGASTAYANAITAGTGILRLGHVDALGTTAAGTTVSSGGALDLNGLAIGAEGLTLNGTGVSSGGALINSSGTAASLSGAISLATASSVGGSGNSTLSGVISGTVGLSKVGAGTVTLDNAETYSGVTTISGGTLALGASGTVASTPSITVASGGVFDISASSFTLGGSQTLVAGRTSGFATDVNGTLSSGGTINPAANGTKGTMTVVGGVSLTGGTVNLDLTGNDTTVGGGINDHINASGALNLSGSTTVNVTWTGSPQTGTYEILNAASLGSGGTANLVKGTGLTDGARITFAFDTTTTPGKAFLVVSGGPASLTWVGDGAGNVWDIGGTPNWDNAGSGDNFYDLDSVTFNDTSANGAVDVSVAVSPTSVTVSNSSTAYSFTGSGKISGAAGLTKVGSSTLTVATPNDNSGTTTIGGGTVIVADGGALGSGAVVNNATLQLDNASPITFNNTISGTGALTKTSAGTATVNGVNTYDGNTTISAGTFKVGTGGPIPNGAGKGNVALTGMLDLAGTGETINGLSGGGTVDNSTGTCTLIVGDNDATSSFSGTIQNTAGTLALTKTGGGTLSLSGIGTYGGATTISGGKLAVSGGSAIPNGSTVSIANGATLQVDATETIGGLSTVSGSTVNAASGTLTFTTGSIIGNLAGSGTVVRHGTADTASGQFTTANALAFNGTLRLRGSTPSTSPASMQGGTGRFWLESTNGSQAAGTAFALDTGASAIDAQDMIFGDWDATSGNRKLTLSSLSGYGTIRNDSGATGTRTLVVDQSSGDATFNGMLLSHTAGDGRVRTVAFEKKGSSSLTLANVVGKQTASAGAANADIALTVTAGTLTLSAVNSTLTGPTVVNGGTLVINGTHPSGATVAVNSGGTLGGTGVISGTLTVAAGGIMAPGESIGQLTVGGTPSLGGTLLMEINRNGGSPLSDNINFTGGATFGGTLIVTNVGATAQSGDTFDLFDGSVSGAFTTVTVPTGGLTHWKTNNLVVDGSITFSNASPVAANLTAGVVHGGTVTLPVIGGKNGATDADGDTLSVTAVSTPGSGSASFGASNVTYVASGSTGTNTFTYTVTDALGATDTKTVTVVVTDPQGFNQVSAGVDGGNAVLTYLGIPGTNYALEVTHNLPATNWVPVITNTASSIGYLYFTNPISLSPTNDYYRTHYVP